MNQIRTPICPADDFECPYYKRGFCHMMPMTGSNPIAECDAWADDEEEDEDDE